MTKTLDVDIVDIPAWLWEDKIYIGWVDPDSFIIVGGGEDEER